MYKTGGNNLTNNFRANMLILVLGATAYSVYLFVDGHHTSPVSIYGFMETEGAKRLLCFVASYFLTSYWFSPDLDLRDNRPGKNSFPLKWLIKLVRRLRNGLPLLTPPCDLLLVLLDAVHMILNQAWRLLWQPLSFFVTHRGVVHLPIIGTQIKIVYIHSLIWLLSRATFFAGFSSFFADTPYDGLGYVESIVGRGGLYRTLIENPLLNAAWLGAMVADICHTSIDFWDSFKKGSKFVPPDIIAPRGLFVQLFRFFSKRLF